MTLPKKETTVKTILNHEQLEPFMEAIKADEHWHHFFYLEITTGLRRGELCGLMWTDFDEMREEHCTQKREVATMRERPRRVPAAEQLSFRPARCSF